MAHTSQPKAKSKAAMWADVANLCGLTNKQVDSVMDALGEVIRKELNDTGCVNVPELIKLHVETKPAREGGKVIPNPWKKGEVIVTKPKPEKKLIKCTALRKLKNML